MRVWEIVSLVLSAQFKCISIADVFRGLNTSPQFGDERDPFDGMK